MYKSLGLTAEYLSGKLDALARAWCERQTGAEFDPAVSSALDRLRLRAPNREGRPAVGAGCRHVVTAGDDLVRVLQFAMDLAGRVSDSLVYSQIRVALQRAREVSDFASGDPDCDEPDGDFIREQEETEEAITIFGPGRPYTREELIAARGTR